MHVGLIAPPWVPVPPTVYGGTELVVDQLARGLTGAGCDVTLFTTGDGTCPVRRRWLYPKALGIIDNPDAELRHVEAFLSFVDPSGNAHDLVVRPQHSGRRYFASRDCGVWSFSHIGLRTTDAARDEAFWTTVLNARVSDRIGAAALLRIHEVHHTIALFPSTYPGVQHVNHQVHGVDDVMRAYYFMRERGVRIVFGPGRHPTSGAVFLYFEGPDGMVYEYSTGVRLIKPEEEAAYRPRQFPFAASSFCMWGSKPDIPEFRTKEDAAPAPKAA